MTWQEPEKGPCSTWRKYKAPCRGKPPSKAHSYALKENHGYVHAFCLNKQDSLPNIQRYERAEEKT
ncbi:hypothetical protein ABE82_24900 [Paenibacillus peoriae]|uniref:Uncharacterized protein n=1 Tax=Paenibacillus polymyxa TaxID=1406 RepID=A0ABX2ZH86_PAEPO|nr:hypothetical protein ABE82_24900 [Paenibacillus peoriae]ODA09952.1 hypothetical protein A7312_02175 [Paenibacillus polymyxa]ODB57871.1 hypothetical protein A7309_05625 [Paenibacillus polymyxa]OME73719.1 hypothetical protein BK119_04310 [Paenibacillus peoriae]OMF36437.1 hypothetical protein BK134_02200 [Paenibacillus peoriae]